MNRKLIVFIALIIYIITITGCSIKKEDTSKETIKKTTPKEEIVKVGNVDLKLNESSSFKDLNFKYPEASELGSIGNYTSIAYKNNNSDGDVLFNILLTNFKNKNVDDTMNSSSSTKIGTKNINNIEWVYYADKEDDKSVTTYAYQYNKDTYTITFLSEENLTTFIDLFMKNVSFS